MTAILDDMRRLDAAHARGEISAADLAARKTELMDAVPDVFDETADAPHPSQPDEAPEMTGAGRTRPGIGQALLLCALILTVCVGAALTLTGDIMLSMTLAITVLAACTVMLFTQLDG